MKEFSNHFDMLTEIERLEKQVEILKDHIKDIATCSPEFIESMEIKFPHFSDWEQLQEHATQALEKIEEIK